MNQPAISIPIRRKYFGGPLDGQPLPQEEHPMLRTPHGAAIPDDVEFDFRQDLYWLAHAEAGDVWFYVWTPLMDSTYAFGYLPVWEFQG
jgi:hypothetical protein